MTPLRSAVISYQMTVKMLESQIVEMMSLFFLQVRWRRVEANSTGDPWPKNDISLMTCFHGKSLRYCIINFLFFWESHGFKPPRDLRGVCDQIMDACMHEFCYEYPQKSDYFF